MSESDWLKEIVRIPLGNISYQSHPDDAVLRDYLLGRLTSSGPLNVTGLRTGNISAWQRPDVTAHLLTCNRCARIVAQLRTKMPSRLWLKTLTEKLSPKEWSRRLQPVPAFARLIMAVQFVIILALAGVIYFKPPQLFPSQNPVATVLPPPEASQAQAPQPQRATTDEVPQLIQALHSTDPEARLQAAEALGRTADPRAVEALTVALDNPYLRETASRALEQIWQRTETYYQQIRQAFGSLRLKHERGELTLSLSFEGFESETTYPYTIRVTFKEDTRAREIEGLVRDLNGVLVYGVAGKHEFVVKLPISAGERLDEIMQQLQENPQIVEVRKD